MLSSYCTSATVLTYVYFSILRDQGSNPYIVPLGGWSQVGLFGYINAFQELIDQV